MIRRGKPLLLLSSCSWADNKIDIKHYNRRKIKILIQTHGVLTEIGPTATAAAKSLQLCPTLCNPIDGSPPGSPIPGILQARTLEWVAISFSNA